MAPHNEEDDPAIYRSSARKANGHSNGAGEDDEEVLGFMSKPIEYRYVVELPKMIFEQLRIQISLSLGAL